VNSKLNCLKCDTISLLELGSSGKNPFDPVRFNVVSIQFDLIHQYIVNLLRRP